MNNQVKHFRFAKHLFKKLFLVRFESTFFPVS